MHTKQTKERHHFGLAIAFIFYDIRPWFNTTIVFEASIISLAAPHNHSCTVALNSYIKLIVLVTFPKNTHKSIKNKYLV